MVLRFNPGPTSNRIWYYQDAHGNTTHLGDDSGNRIESYKYPPADAGTPAVFNGAGQSIAASAFENRFLFTGREYYRQGGFYDYRNRTYLPSLGRFIQADPIGFKGDPTNLYRYAGNMVGKRDPMGLDFETGTHAAGFFPHWYVGVDDWTLQSGGMRYFDFSPTKGTQFGGHWDDSATQPGHYTANGFQSTTPAQDLVLINAYYLSQDSPPFYFFLGCECQSRIFDVEKAALGSQGFGYNPVDPYTGNIFDAQGNWAGWQDLDTGNIYDADGDWAGWMPTSSGNGAGGAPSSGGTSGSGSGGGPQSGHFGTTGNYIPGPAFTVVNLFPGLTSAGGGDWQDVMYFPGGGQPGEGTHPVSFELR